MTYILEDWHPKLNNEHEWCVHDSLKRVFFVSRHVIYIQEEEKMSFFLRMLVIATLKLLVLFRALCQGILFGGKCFFLRKSYH